MRGLLITLEGIDGSGKSTVASVIESRLSRLEGLLAERSFVFTSEPTNGEIGQLLRSYLSKQRSKSEKKACAAPAALEELFLFMADHSEHLVREVIPALEEGFAVVSDRYSDSRIAYQGVTLRGIVPDPVEWVQELHRPWSITPDLTILFKIDPALAVRRCNARSVNAFQGESKVRDEANNAFQAKAREKFEREDFLGEVQEVFEYLAKSEPERFVVIDAREKIDAVADAALSAILDRLGDWA